MKETIITCDRCGKRVTRSQYSDVTVHHNSQTEYWYQLCDSCKPAFRRWFKTSGTAI